MVSAAEIPTSRMGSLSEKFSQAIHDQTDRKWFHHRIYDSFSTLTKTHGYTKTACLASTTVAAQIITGVFSYMLIEGSVRSLMEVAHNSATFEALRPLGDMAGWTPLATFTLLVMKDIYERAVGEGEYYKVVKICEDWIGDNLANIQNNPSFQKDLYGDIKQTLKNYSSRCFSNKNVASRNLTAWKIFKHTTLDDPNAPYANGKAYKQEIAVKNIVKDIHKELETASANSNFFFRCFKSWSMIRKRGTLAALTARLIGLVIPFFITATSGLAIPGEGALLHQVYINATENADALPDRGHGGEWPINVFDTIALSYFLFIWYFLSEGDLASTHKIYADKLNVLQINHEKNKHEALRQLGREELIETALQCHYLRTGMELKFEPYQSTLAASTIPILVL